MSVFVWGMWMSSNEPGVFLFEPDLSLLSSKSYISLLVGAYPLGALFHVRASQLEIYFHPVTCRYVYHIGCVCKNRSMLG